MICLSWLDFEKKNIPSSRFGYDPDKVVDFSTLPLWAQEDFIKYRGDQYQAMHDGDFLSISKRSIKFNGKEVVAKMVVERVDVPLEEEDDIED